MKRFRVRVGDVELHLVQLSEPICSICGSREIGTGGYLIETRQFTEALDLDQQDFVDEMVYEIGLVSFFDGKSIGFDLLDLDDVLLAIKDENPIAYGIERALMLLALGSIAADAIEVDGPTLPDLSRRSGNGLS